MFVGLGQAEKGILFLLQERGVLCVADVLAAYPDVLHRVEWQREMRSDPKLRMAFCIDLITRKIDGCIKTLEKSIRRSSHSISW
jgi:CRISPR-associated protein Cas1